MSFVLLDSEIQYFLKVARAKTFLAASESLGLSQPALSRAMTRLEEKLGFKLFERSRSGVELTEQGEKLLVGIKDLGEDIQNLVENIKNHAKEIGGEIRISGHQSVLEDFLIPVYSQLILEFPKVRFHLESKTSRQVVDDILSGRTDIGIVINPVEYSPLIIRPLRQTKAFFYSQVKEIQKYFLNPQMIDLGKFLKVIRKNFLDESDITFIDDYDLIANLVKDGAGCGLLPEHVGERYNLKVSPGISSQFKIHYDLKLVTSTLAMSEKKRQVSRFVENLLKA